MNSAFHDIKDDTFKEPPEAPNFWEWQPDSLTYQASKLLQIHYKYRITLLSEEMVADNCTQGIQQMQQTTKDASHMQVRDADGYHLLTKDVSNCNR